MEEVQKILLNVSYTDETGKWWRDSAFDKGRVIAMQTGESVHDTIAKALEKNDGVEMCYRGKPRGNVYVDGKNGESIPVGYIYRVKDEYMQGEDGKWHTAFFTAWVQIWSVSTFPIVDLLEK